MLVAFELKPSAVLEEPVAFALSPTAKEDTARAFRDWAREERLSWLRVMSEDPLLPKVLLPAGYQGCKAWTRRKQVLSSAAAQLRQFG